MNDGKLRYTAAAIPPEENEAGWKDTVREDPGMVTRIVVRFEGFAGRYVCHLPATIGRPTNWPAV